MIFAGKPALQNVWEAASTTSIRKTSASPEPQIERTPDVPLHWSLSVCGFDNLTLEENANFVFLQFNKLTKAGRGGAHHSEG
jgi:hypothetical protein